MTIIEKIEKGIITLAEFTEDQQSFIRGIVKLSFNEGQKQALRIPNVMCSCGGGDGAYHPIAENGCFRYHVTDPNEIPRNRRRIYNPDWFKEPVFIWDIGDHWVTEYTLFNQRMYSQDKNGNWTRPKSKDSVNSLEGDW